MQQVIEISETRTADTNPARLLSLDVFRGITISGMILVNNPGSWDAIYSPLRHAVWHGWTPTDLVFPFFLFIVGVSISLALRLRARQAGSGRRVGWKIVRRAAIIFALGLVIYGFPYYQLATIRIPGVLQRIAVCYLVASIIFLKTGWKVQVAIIAVLLLIYWLVMTLIPAPGYAAGDLTTEGNLAAYIDRLLLSGHLYTPVYDPEGILSTVPAIATTLSGVLCGSWLSSDRDPMEKTAGLFVGGLCGIIVGWACGGLFPINKALWTSSYTVFTAGMALQFLGFCYWLIDIKGYRRWAKPFIIFGLNSIIVYVLSELVGLMLGWNALHIDGSPVSTKQYIYSHLFESWASPKNGSLLWAITIVLLWLGIMALLYRKRIFIKI